jgi:hypothetical protein
LVDAIVDEIGQNWYRVTATGKPPFAETRIYYIRAKSDTIAARDGIQRFVEEMEAKQLKEARHANDAGTVLKH